MTLSHIDGIEIESFCYALQLLVRSIYLSALDLCVIVYVNFSRFCDLQLGHFGVFSSLLQPVPQFFQNFFIGYHADTIANFVPNIQINK